MVKRKSIRISLKSNSKAKADVSRKAYDERQKQISDAIEYCLENDCKGKAALKTGRFPLIKDHKTITRRLNGEVVHGNERISHSILLPQEETLLVNYVKNKSRAMQPLTRKSMNHVIMNVLRSRRAANLKKTGRKRVKLSHYARKALHKGEVGQYFWYRFDAKHPDITRKKVGSTSLSRAIACTKGMAVKHLDSLAEELIRLNIMKDAKQINPGVWSGEIDVSRVYNCDETPQAINYGADGHASSLAYCPRGEECSKVTKENREFVTVTPFIGLSGSVPMCQMIFASSSITSWMAPTIAVENIKNLLISVTANGYQDGSSCLKSFMKFDKFLDEEGITRPVLLLTDGHSSRFDLAVLRFLSDKNIAAFVSPPDTTSVTQPLDQINAALHSAYRREISHLFVESYVNREVFMVTLAKMWNNWGSTDTVINAFHRVGITKDGLSVEWMQEEKFKAAASLLEDADSNDPEKESPEVKRKCTKAYYKAKLEEAHKKIMELESTIVTPEEIPGFFHFEKIRPKKTKNTRITQVHGSLEGSMILELREKIQEVKKEKEAKKEQMLNEKAMRREFFLRCKESCVCSEDVCKASGLRQCCSCKDVMKTQCSKSKCKSADGGDKPVMLVPHCDKKSKRPKKTKTWSKSEESSDDDISFLQDEVIDENKATCSTFGSKGSYVYHAVSGDWVEVLYDGVTYTGLVVAKEEMEMKIRCLNYHQDGFYVLESEKASVWYNEIDIIGKCDYVPILVDDDKEAYIL